jgi:hypothetical protein
MTIFPQLETDLLDAHQRLTDRRRSRAIGWLASRGFATRTSVLLAGATLGLAGGATALAASAGVAPFGPSITGTVVANPPGPGPEVNGVRVDPTTGALPQAPPWRTVATKTGTIASTPSGPAPAVNGVPINPTTGALPQGMPGSTTTSQTGTPASATITREATGTPTSNPSGPAPAVNGVPINPTTGALPQGMPGSTTTSQTGTPASATTTKQGTIASAP